MSTMGSGVRDIGSILAAAVLGTVGTDLFEGLMPKAPSNAIAIYETPGRPPVRTSALTIATERLRFSIAVRNLDYEIGFTLANNVRAALQGWKGVVNGNTYLDVTMDTTVFALGRVESGEFLFTMHLSAMRVPR